MAIGTYDELVLLFHEQHAIRGRQVRRQAKAQFRENAHLRDEDDIKRAVARGRWYLSNELVGVRLMRRGEFGTWCSL